MRQHVIRLGLTLAALQFAGEVCCAQSRAADELFPRGSLFPCAAYSVGSGPVLQANADLLRYRPSGFNLLGPQYGPNQTVLQETKTYGLRGIYTVGADVDFLKEKGLPKPVDELAAEVNAQVSKVAADRTIAWWYLAQEELRTWRRDEMLYLEKITEAIRKADPLRSTNTDVRCRTSLECRDGTDRPILGLRRQRILRKLLGQCRSACLARSFDTAGGRSGTTGASQADTPADTRNVPECARGAARPNRTLGKARCRSWAYRRSLGSAYFFLRAAK